MSSHSGQNPIHAIIDGWNKSITSHAANDDDCQNRCNDLIVLLLLRRLSRFRRSLNRGLCRVMNAACRLLFLTLAKPKSLLRRLCRRFLPHQLLSNHRLASSRHLVRKIIGVRNIGNRCGWLGRLLNGVRYRCLIPGRLCILYVLSRHTILHCGLRSLNSGLNCRLNDGLRLNAGNMGLRRGRLLYRGLSRSFCRAFLCEQCINYFLLDLSNRTVRHNAGAVCVDIGRNFLAVNGNMDNANRLAQNRIRFHGKNLLSIVVGLCINAKHLSNRVSKPVQQNICNICNIWNQKATFKSPRHAA